MRRKFDAIMYVLLALGIIIGVLGLFLFDNTQIAQDGFAFFAIIFLGISLGYFLITR